MNTTQIISKTAVQTRALDHVARCSADFDRAMVERNAIDDCSSVEWRLAHGRAKQCSEAKKNAFNHAYACGALPRPYWA